MADEKWGKGDVDDPVSQREFYRGRVLALEGALEGAMEIQKQDQDTISRLRRERDEAQLDYELLTANYAELSLDVAQLREDEAALIEVRAALRTPGGRDVVLSARAVRSLADRRAKG